MSLTDSEKIVLDHFLGVLADVLGDRISNDWSLPDTLTEAQKKEFCEAFNQFGSKHDIPIFQDGGMTFDWLVVIFLQERLRGSLTREAPLHPLGNEPLRPRLLQDDACNGFFFEGNPCMCMYLCFREL